VGLDPLSAPSGKRSFDEILQDVGRDVRTRA
jgi:hypothetical protein